jgi:hypothetical protein
MREVRLWMSRLKIYFVKWCTHAFSLWFQEIERFTLKMCILILSPKPLLDIWMEAWMRIPLSSLAIR